MTARAGIWINAIAFQIAWTITVAGAAHGNAWAGPLALLVFAAWQMSVSRNVRSDACLVAFAIVLGGSADSWLAHTQIVRYTAPWPSADFAPIWILALWANLALTLNHSLAFLQRNLPLAAVLGALGAPLSYLIAARAWHAVALAEPLTTTLLALAALWAVATPILGALARTLARRDTQLTRAASAQGARP